MSEPTALSPLDATSHSPTRQFDILNLRDYYSVMQELSQNAKKFDFMQTAFKLSYDLTRGLDFDELDELFGPDRGINAHLALEEVRKLSNGQSTCVAISSSDPKVSETTVIFGQMSDNKYDVLDIRVKQTAEIDQKKLAAIAIGATCAGVVTGAVATPVVGAITTGFILSGAGLKVTYDHLKSRPDWLYGYILKELNDKNVIRVEDGHPFI